MRFLLVLLISCGAACGTTVDPADFEPIDGYQDWWEMDVIGKIPGHGNTYRKIFVNDIGRTYGHGGRYPIGTVLVKEVYSLEDGDQPGTLGEVGIMRKVARDNDDPLIDTVDAPVDEGWVFSYQEGDSETSFPLCFATCHRQGPFDHAWFDYGE